MTENEYKKQLLELGVKEEQLANINFGLVDEIISRVENIDELCDLMVKNFPDFHKDEFKKALTEAAESSTKASAEAQDLSDEELAEVAGGSVGSWIKKNKEAIAITAFSLIALGGLIYGVNKLLDSGCASNRPSNVSDGDFQKRLDRVDNFLLH